MSFEARKYKLINNDISESSNNPLWLTNDPRNSEKSKRTLKRSVDTFATFTQISDDFEFTKEGDTFLKQAFAFKDSEADVYMEEWRVHPQTEILYLYNKSKFNFSKIVEHKTFVSIPFKTGGLNALIKAQLKEKFELERLESINGKVINALDKKDVALTSREILLISKLETASQDAISTSFRMNFSDNNPRTGSLGIPTEVTINSDDKLQYVIRDSSFTTTPDTGELLSMFYLNNDVTKTLNIKIKMYCEIKEKKVDDLANEFMKVDLVTFENGLTLDLKGRTTLHNVTMSQINGWVIDFEYEADITLLVGESLSLQWYGGGDFGSGLPFPDDGDLKVDFQETLAIIDIVEESQREDSQTKAVLFHEAGDKLMQIITGEQGRYYSEYFSDGDFSMLGVALGFWIRGFDDKNIEWSLKDRLKTANVICNTGYNIEIINDVEVLVEEDLKYFFQEATAIILPDEISEAEEMPADLFYHSSLEFGYKKPDGDNLYEEAMGLDEYNIRNGYLNKLTSTDKKYSKISPDRADAYGKEFARRKPQIDFPEEDTRYDKHKHILDLKTGNGLALEEHVWQDDFEIAPIGVFSPKTATNLRLTPANIKERHEWFFNPILEKHQEEYIRYSNSNGNSELVTKKTGETALSERGDILNSNLERALFKSKFITFDHRITFDINEQIYGKTEVNGRMIPNFYFKVKYKYNGRWEYGYLFEVTEQGREIGKWKLLKAA